MSRFVPWSLVALCFAVGVASRSISESFVVFVPSLQDAFAASRSSVTVVYSFSLLVFGSGAAVAGWIVDRFGLRALTVIGMSAAAVATASASQATHLWQLYLGLGVVMGFAGASLSGVLSSSVLGRWFPAHRLGVAMAVAWSASGVGAIVILPLAEHIIATAHVERNVLLSFRIHYPVLFKSDHTAMPMRTQDDARKGKALDRDCVS